MKKGFSLFLILVFFGSLSSQDRNFGFYGKKNEIKFDPIPAIHNGSYGLKYRRSVSKFLCVSAGYSVISKTGRFTHYWTDTNEVYHIEPIVFENFGTAWNLGVIWTSPYANVPSPIGLYAGLEFEHTGNEFSELLDTTTTPFNYQHRRNTIKGLLGCNYYLGKGLTLDIGLEAGFCIGSVLPLNSYAAFRVPVRQYPDQYIWSLDNRFEYDTAISTFNGAGTTSFATVRLSYFKFWFYPSVKLGVMF